MLVKFINNKVFLVSFYLSLDAITGFLVVLVIAFFPGLFECRQHLVTQCYMLVNFFIKPFLRIVFNVHLPYRCDLINGGGEFSNEIRIPYAQLISVNFEYSGNFAFSSSCR